MNSALMAIAPIDEHGNTVARTKFTHPYSYDGFVVWDERAGEDQPDTTVYADRLFQWNPEKYNHACEQVFGNRGQYWHEREAVDIEKFLHIYTGNESLKLLMVMEYCDQARGYPCWRFDYKANA